MPVRRGKLLGRQDEWPVCVAGLSSRWQGKTQRRGDRGRYVSASGRWGSFPRPRGREGVRHLDVQGSSLSFVLEVTCRTCSAKPASEMREQSTISCLANCCGLCRRTCWLPPTSRGSARLLTLVLPGDPVNVCLGIVGCAGARELAGFVFLPPAQLVRRGAHPLFRCSWVSPWLPEMFSLRGGSTKRLFLVLWSALPGPEGFSEAGPRRSNPKLRS